MSVNTSRPPIDTALGRSAAAFDGLATVVWTAISEYVEAFTLRRGRQHERGSTQPGMGSMTLDNTDRRFDPTYTTGPYTTTLLTPKRRARKMARWGPILDVTGATNTTPIVITTATPHGFAVGDVVHHDGFTTNVFALGYRQVIAVPDSTSYHIGFLYSGDPVAGSGDYTSGDGTAQRAYHHWHGYAVDFPSVWAGPNKVRADVELIDAFALFNEIPIPASAWELEVSRDNPTFWFVPGGQTATDASGNNRHGTYQGRGAFDAPLVPGYDAVSFAPNRNDTPGARASFPYKDLIAGFPFSVETVFRSGEERTAEKEFFVAISAPGSGWQGISMFIEAATGHQGKIRARFTTSQGTNQSFVRSTITVDDGTIHHLVWTAASASDMKLYVDGVDVSGDTGSTAAFPADLSVGYSIGNFPAFAYGDYSFATQPGDALGDVVFYDHVLSTARIAAHHIAATTGWAGDRTGTRLGRLLDWIGWPADDRDIDTGATTLPARMPAGPLLRYIQEIERAEGGLTFMSRSGKVTHRDRFWRLTDPGNVSQWTFGDGAGEIAYDPPVIFGGTESEMITRAQGARAGGPRLEAISDQEGADSNIGVRALVVPDLQVETDEQVRDFLRYQLTRYDRPKVRVRQVRIRPQEDPDVVWPKILDVADGSMVTFTASPPGGGDKFVQTSHLEATDESWTGTDVTVSYELSPADLTVYAQFGTARFGHDIFAY